MRIIQQKRCAIYTRKSVDEGLDMEFNTLDAQRLACENYIASQIANGWVALPERYDDGGVSGGTLERPALKRLMADAAQGRIDIIVIYKIDRLTRSISDFAELSKKFDEWQIAFCSITQEINTSTSSGRMMLNILLTFAQFEREVIAERIRDKMSASRKRGQWIGGTIPFGYMNVNRHLLPDPEKAPIVPEIFDYFARCGSAKETIKWLNGRGILTRQGKPWLTSSLYRLLNNHTYNGDVFYKGEVYPGEHERLVSEEQWNQIQEILKENASVPKGTRMMSLRYAPLRGLIHCGHCGGLMSPTYTEKRNHKYAYYICLKDTTRDLSTCPIRRVGAGDMEKAVVEQVGVLFRSPTFVSQVARHLDDDITAVMEALQDIESFWQDLFPLEQNRLLHLLVDRVTVYQDALEIKVKTSGMRGLIKELTNVQN